MPEPVLMMPRSIPRRATRWRRGSWCLAALLAWSPPVGAQEVVEALLRERVAALRDSARLEVAGREVLAPAAMLALYGGTAPAMIWDRESGAALITALGTLTLDGLRPRHYRLDLLRAGADGVSGPAQRVELELLRTDALLAALADLRFGRATPDRSAVRAATVEALTGLPTAAFRERLRAGLVAPLLEEARPGHFLYRDLSRALGSLLRIAEDGGWNPLPAGPPMRRDSLDRRVPALRRRLLLEGDLPPGWGNRSRVFDAALEEAVLAFQRRHALAADGVVGPRTLAELNLPVEVQIDRLRVNLDRARWVLHGMPDTLLLVNVASAHLYLLAGEEVRHEARVIVGATRTQTPVFRAMLRAIELNPDWEVPAGINDEILAAIRADTGYLAREGFEVLNREDRVIDPDAVAFDRFTGATLPYRFRQRPGPRNALGRIKFVLPNRHSVYLHDTPDRTLFSSDRRTFSHGCIRVADPVRLAALVLDAPAWGAAAIDSAIATGDSLAIPLDHPLPVVLEYWTATTLPNGALHLVPDLYRRDAEVLAALNRE